MFNRKTALGTSSSIKLTWNHPLREYLQSIANKMVNEDDFSTTMQITDRGCIAEGGKIWVDIIFGNERVYTPLRYINPQIAS